MRSMEEYNLKQLLEQIVNLSENVETFTVKELWEWTLFDGENIYLNDSLKIHKYSGAVIEGRKSELSNNQIIKGNYLLFDYVGHIPGFSIKQYESLDNMIDAIISPAGILNSFTTLQIPIINGNGKDISFILNYKDKAFGNKLAKELKPKKIVCGKYTPGFIENKILANSFEELLEKIIKKEIYASPPIDEKN
jgi:hypothetical protein